jgi:hypothetical protein
MATTIKGLPMDAANGRSPLFPYKMIKEGRGDIIVTSLPPLATITWVQRGLKEGGNFCHCNISTPRFIWIVISFMSKQAYVEWCTSPNIKKNININIQQEEFVLYRHSILIHTRFHPYSLRTNAIHQTCVWRT